MLFDRYDQIRIINLAHRTDRRAEMIRELRRVGLDGDPRVSFFDACTFADAGTFYSKGARGAYHSHLTILEEAAREGRSVLIFEDDVDFTPEAASYDLPETPPIFYGAYNPTRPDDLPNSDIMGSHFMGFSADTARMVATYLRTILNSGHHPPIDGAYVWFRRAHPEVRTVFATSQLGNQRPSRTDIAALRFYDRMPGLRQAATLARKARSSRTGRSGLGGAAALAAGGLTLIAAVLAQRRIARTRSRKPWTSQP